MKKRIAMLLLLQLLICLFFSIIFYLLHDRIGIIENRGLVLWFSIYPSIFFILFTWMGLFIKALFQPAAPVSDFLKKRLFSTWFLFALIPPVFINIGPAALIILLKIAVLIFIATDAILLFIITSKYLSSVHQKKNPVINRTAVFLFFALCLSSFAVYESRFSELTGDEPYFILMAHSLYEDGDLELTDEYRRKTSLEFMSRALGPQDWDPNRDGRLYSRHSPLPSLIILPAFILAGRTGAAVTPAITGAVFALLWFSSAVLIFRNADAVFKALCVLMFTVPLFPYTRRIYTEIFGAAAIMGLFYLYLMMTKRGLARIAGSICLTTVTGLLKMRYLMISIPLLILSAAKKKLPRKITLIVAAIFILLLSLLAGYNIYRFGTLLFGHNLDSLMSSPIRLALGSLALLLDQQYGILFYSPVLLFTLAGISRLLGISRVKNETQSHKILFQTLKGIFLLAPYFLVIASSAELIGGYSSPGRFMVVWLALASLPLVGYFAIGKKGIVFQSALGLSLGWSAVFLINPSFQFNVPGETNKFFEWLYYMTELRLHRLFPLFDRPDTFLIFQLTGLALAGVGILVIYFKLKEKKDILSRWNVPPFPLICLFAVFLLCMGIMGTKISTAIIEAEDPEAVRTGGRKVWHSTFSKIWPYKTSWRLPPMEEIKFPLIAAGVDPQVLVNARCPEPGLKSVDLILFINGKMIDRKKINTDIWKSYSFKTQNTRGNGQAVLRCESNEDRPIDIDYVNVNPSPVWPFLGNLLKRRDEPLISKNSLPNPIEFEDTPRGTLNDVRIFRSNLAPAGISQGQGFNFSFQYSRSSETSPGEHDYEICLFSGERSCSVPITLQKGKNLQYDRQLELPFDMGTGRFFTGLKINPADPESVIKVSERTMFFDNVMVLNSIEVSPGEGPKPDEKAVRKLKDMLKSAVFVLPHTVAIAGYDQIELKMPAAHLSSEFVLVSRVSHVLSVIPFNTKIAEVTFVGEDRNFKFPIIIGRNTAEEAYDFPTVKGKLPHSRPDIFSSWPAVEFDIPYTAHNYLTRITLDEPVIPQKVTFASAFGKGVFQVDVAAFLPVPQKNEKFSVRPLKIDILHEKAESP